MQNFGGRGEVIYMKEQLEGMELIRHTAIQRRSGMVFDQRIAQVAAKVSDELLTELLVDPATAQRVALFRHLPGPLQEGVTEGRINVLIDFTGNAAIHKQE